MAARSEAKILVLNRPLYGMGQVDDLAGLRPGTARRWLEGYERSGRSYPPVIRPAPTGVELATWGEFVEVYLMAGYRAKGVNMLRMRPAIERLREKTGVPYPLAHLRPLTDGRQFLLEMQEDLGLTGEERLVTERGNQIVLRPVVEQFLQRVEFDGDIAERLRPAGRGSPVVIDPLHSFGLPVVKNAGEIRSIRTEILVEEFKAGDSIEEIASGYALERTVVEAAVRFEMERRPVSHVS